MFRSTVLPAHECATYELSKELSLPMEGAQFREIGGWVYQRIVLPGGKDMTPPQAWLMPILVRVAPKLPLLLTAKRHPHRLRSMRFRPKRVT